LNTGLTNGTTYYYRAFPTNGVNPNTTITGQQVSATPQSTTVNPVTYFSVWSGWEELYLEWENPSSGPFTNVIIVRNENDFPASIGDGDLVYQGNDEFYADSGLTNGWLYYYRIFTTDGININDTFDGQTGCCTPGIAPICSPEDVLKRHVLRKEALFEAKKEVAGDSDESLILDYIPEPEETTFNYEPNDSNFSEYMENIIKQAVPRPQTEPELMGAAGGQEGLTQYSYDLFNRQIGVQRDGMTASYSYNPNGLRAGSTITGGMGSNGSGSVTTKYIWNGQNIVAELDGSNNVTATYTRGHNLISQRRGSTSQFYLYNGHGDVVQLTDTDGNMVKNYSYDAFGVEKDPDPNDTNIWRYAGEMYDKDTETYYLRARYYTPGTGRFLTGDTYWNSNNMIYGDGGNATPNLAAIRQSSNLYIFCINNPLMFIDPSGYKIKLSSNATDVEKREYERAIAYLKNSEDGKKLIEKLEKADEIILITFISNHDDGYTGSKDGTKRTIEWDPTSGLLMSDGTSIQSAALGLAHEMGHAAQHLDGAYFSFKTNDAREANNLEKYEKPIAKQLGEPIRARFENELGGYRMNNSTHYRTTHTRSWYDYIAPWNWGKPKTYTKDHNAK
jgi:RHS repeat-associated protein